MNQFRYFMPTDTYFGRGCIKANQDVLRRYGTKAMLVTGKTSAKKNGAQKDVTVALDALGIALVVFEEFGENPYASGGGSDNGRYWFGSYAVRHFDTA